MRARALEAVQVSLRTASSSGHREEGNPRSRRSLSAVGGPGAARRTDLQPHELTAFAEDHPQAQPDQDTRREGDDDQRRRGFQAEVT